MTFTPVSRTLVGKVNAKAAPAPFSDNQWGIAPVAGGNDDTVRFSRGSLPDVYGGANPRITVSWRASGTLPFTNSITLPYVTGNTDFVVGKGLALEFDARVVTDHKPNGKGAYSGLPKLVELPITITQVGTQKIYYEIQVTPEIGEIDHIDWNIDGAFYASVASDVFTIPPQADTKIVSGTAYIEIGSLVRAVPLTPFTPVYSAIETEPLAPIVSKVGDLPIVINLTEYFGFPVPSETGANSQYGVMSYNFSTALPAGVNLGPDPAGILPGNDFLDISNTAVLARTTITIKAYHSGTPLASAPSITLDLTVNALPTVNVIYNSDFNEAQDAWPTQVNGANIIVAAGGVPSVTHFPSQAAGAGSTGTTGALRFTNTSDYQPQRIRLPVVAGQAYDIDVRGWWENLSGTICAGAFHVYWVNASFAKIDVADRADGDLFRAPTSSSFGSTSKNLDYLATGKVAPAGAAFLQIEFGYDGTNNPRWTRGRGWLHRIKLQGPGGTTLATLAEASITGGTTAGSLLTVGYEAEPASETGTITRQWTRTPVSTGIRANISGQTGTTYTTNTTTDVLAEIGCLLNHPDFPQPIYVAGPTMTDTIPAFVTLPTLTPAALTEGQTATFTTGTTSGSNVVKSTQLIFTPTSTGIPAVVSTSNAGGTYTPSVPALLTLSVDLDNTNPANPINFTTTLNVTAIAGSGAAQILYQNFFQNDGTDWTLDMQQAANAMYHPTARFGDGGYLNGNTRGAMLFGVGLSGNQSITIKRIPVNAGDQVELYMLCGQAGGGISRVVKSGGNTGNGTITQIAKIDNSLQSGAYSLRFTSATAFTVTRVADGFVVGSGTVGTWFDTVPVNDLTATGSMRFKITAGGTPFVAGDGWDITVAGTLNNSTNLFIKFLNTSGVAVSSPAASSYSNFSGVFEKTFPAAAVDGFIEISILKKGTPTNGFAVYVIDCLNIKNSGPSPQYLNDLPTHDTINTVVGLTMTFDYAANFSGNPTKFVLEGPSVPHSWAGSVLTITPNTLNTYVLDKDGYPVWNSTNWKIVAYNAGNSPCRKKAPLDLRVKDTPAMSLNAFKRPFDSFIEVGRYWTKNPMRFVKDQVDPVTVEILNAPSWVKLDAESQVLIGKAPASPAAAATIRVRITDARGQQVIVGDTYAWTETVIATRSTVVTRVINSPSEVDQTIEDLLKFPNQDHVIQLPVGVCAINTYSGAMAPGKKITVLGQPGATIAYMALNQTEGLLFRNVDFYNPSAPPNDGVTGYMKYTTANGQSTATTAATAPMCEIQERGSKPIQGVTYWPQQHAMFYGCKFRGAPHDLTHQKPGDFEYRYWAAAPGGPRWVESDGGKEFGYADSAAFKAAVYNGLPTAPATVTAQGLTIADDFARVYYGVGFSVGGPALFEDCSFENFTNAVGIGAAHLGFFNCDAGPVTADHFIFSDGALGAVVYGCHGFSDKGVQLQYWGHPDMMHWQPSGSCPKRNLIYGTWLHQEKRAGAAGQQMNVHLPSTDVPMSEDTQAKPRHIHWKDCVFGGDIAAGMMAAWVDDFLIEGCFVFRWPESTSGIDNSARIRVLSRAQGVIKNCLHSGVAIADAPTENWITQLNNFNILTDLAPGGWSITDIFQNWNVTSMAFNSPIKAVKAGQPPSAARFWINPNSPWNQYVGGGKTHALIGPPWLRNGVLAGF